jgi:hypothetical protein
VKKSALFLFVLGLASCTTPKANLAEEEPITNEPNIALKQSDIAEVTPRETKPTLPIVRNTGLRYPDMLGLPQDEQLRSAPGAPTEGKATIIARPPEE